MSRVLLLVTLLGACAISGSCDAPTVSAASQTYTDASVRGVALEDARTIRSQDSVCVVRVLVEEQTLYLTQYRDNDRYDLCSVVRKDDALNIQKRSYSGGKTEFWWYEPMYTLTPSL